MIITFWMSVLFGICFFLRVLNDRGKGTYAAKNCRKFQEHMIKEIPLDVNEGLKEVKIWPVYHQT
jgi:hypothetical protein